MNKPDYSDYVIHFTKNSELCSEGHNCTHTDLIGMSALDRLKGILTSKKIFATNMPWTDTLGVCFTECPWSSLPQHADRYSDYGIGFSKELVYSKLGSPVFYVRPELFCKQMRDEDIYPYLTPFVPYYASKESKKGTVFEGKRIDFTHEREWRVSTDFTFDYSDIEFVIVGKISDLHELGDEVVTAIGMDKFLFMDTYRQIERLWPTHIL